MTRPTETIQTDARPRLNAPSVVDRLVHRFAAEALDILAKPDRPDLMARLDFECRRASAAIVGHEPDADGMALAQHVMLALRIDGDIRLGIRTAFMQFASRILDDRMEEAAADLRDALMGGMPYGRD
jgi:hypothetical protein